MAVTTFVVAAAMQMVWAGPTNAQGAEDRDIFAVRTIAVDSTAGNVIQARAQGLLEGQVMAFRKVISRLVAPEDVELVAEPDSDEIISMVRDFSISGERSSAVRYLSDMSVRFHPGPIRALLRSAGIPFTETVSKPLIIVPLYRESVGERLFLWEDPNPWRIAWEEPAAENGLVPFVLPLGDIDDLTTLSMEQAVEGDQDALGALSARYGAAGSLVVAAEVSVEAASQEELAELKESDVDLEDLQEPIEVINVLLTLTTRHRDLPASQVVLSHAGEPGQELDEVLDAAARFAASTVENEWRIPNRVARDAVTQMTVLLPMSDIRDWVRVRSQLESISLIERLELQAMTRDRAQISLTYAGEIGPFNLALAQKDLVITDYSGVWVVESLALAGDELMDMPVPEHAQHSDGDQLSGGPAQ